MSSKVNAACKTVATRTSKNPLENKQHLTVSEAPSQGLEFYGNCNTLIEVCVKTKGRKRTSTMVSSSPPSHKGIEEKKRPSSSGDSHQNWSGVFREQNRGIIRQLAKRPPSLKSSKCRSDTKETKKQSLSHPKPSYKHLDETPVKQSASQKRIEDHIKSTPSTAIPSSTSIPSTNDSIRVVDRSVQCGGYSDDKYGVLNPIRTLNFLMTELGHLVKDERANKILEHMEEILFRMPMEPAKLSMNQEAITLRTKLEATTIQLEDTSRKMNAMYESLREERDSLQSQVHTQALLLDESQERQLNLERTVKTLKQELEDAIKTAQTRDKAIIELKKEIKGYEFSQKVTADLKVNLAEQTELARQRHLEVQYLTLEKDKFVALSSYKDSLLIELRNAIKELQSHIADQLNGLKDIYVQEENCNPQISLVHGGLACSSPTSTSSRDSNIPTSWHDISDVSLSTVDRSPSKNGNVKNFICKPDKVLVSGNQIKNSEKHMSSVKESHTKDSVNLEFISLPGGESSHTFLPSYKDLGCAEVSQPINKGKEDVVTGNNEKNDGLLISKNINKIMSSECLHLFCEKMHGKETYMKDLSKSQQDLEFNKKQNLERSSLAEDVSNTLKTNLSQNLIGSSITKQFQNMFHDIRVQSRIPVNVPSPPRNYPHPDWNDSTLPSISTASELNVMQSNDT